MRCEDLALQMLQSADSGLHHKAADELAEHLGACPACVARWTAIRRAESILSVAALASPRAGFGQRVMASVASERASLAGQSNPMRRAPRLAVAAVCVSLVSLASAALLIWALLGWNPDALARLAARSLVIALVEASGAALSVATLIRAVAIVWRILPAAAGPAILCAASFAALAVMFSWAWFVGRFGWGAHSVRR
jgi:anti-sigma factor RsiW